MQDDEQQSSTEARPPIPPGLSPGLAAALDDPEVAREAGLYAATLPAPAAPTPRARRHVDRGEFVAALATRQGVSERVAAAAVRIAEALRATADEYPDLTDAEAIEALRAMEAGVHRAGVPRRRTPAAGQ